MSLTHFQNQITSTERNSTVSFNKKPTLRDKIHEYIHKTSDINCSRNTPGLNRENSSLRRSGTNIGSTKYQKLSLFFTTARTLAKPTPRR